MKTLKTLKIIGMVPLVLISATAFGQGSDDRAVPRGGGGSSSSSSDAGSRHTGGSSSGSSASSSSSSGSSGQSAQSGGSQYNDSTPDAARRRPRPGTGTGTRDRYGNDSDRYTSYPNSYYYYDPYAYSWGYPGRSYGRYGSYGYGYGYGYSDYGYSYGDYYGYSPSSSYRSYRYRSGNAAQLRTLVEPAKARVYVDGYYAGIVEDFDGLLQRLNVSPGRHDVTFKLEGYNSHTFSIYANRDQTLKLRFDMVKGSGETRDSIGGEYARRSDEGSDPDRDLDLDRDSARETADRSREVDADQAARRPAPPSPDARRGEVLLDIEPADASVYVDGEFYGKASQITRLELTAGRHRIEVVRPGYRTEETEVNVEGEAKRVVVKLSRR